MMAEWMAGVPEWLDYLLRGIFIFTLMSFCAVILTRMGRNPYWALLAIVPFSLVIGLWVVALQRWPRIDRAASGPIR